MPWKIKQLEVDWGMCSMPHSWWRQCWMFVYDFIPNTRWYFGAQALRCIIMPPPAAITHSNITSLWPWLWHYDLSTQFSGWRHVVMLFHSVFICRQVGKCCRKSGPQFSCFKPQILRRGSKFLTNVSNYTHFLTCEKVWWQLAEGRLRLCAENRWI